MESWLVYIKWYAEQSVSLDRPISSWFDAPVIGRSMELILILSDSVIFGEHSIYVMI